MTLHGERVLIVEDDNNVIPDAWPVTWAPPQLRVEGGGNGAALDIIVKDGAIVDRGSLTGRIRSGASLSLLVLRNQDDRRI
jgi:hypothetical protein